MDLHHPRFVVYDGVTGANGDAPERGDNLPIIFSDVEKDILLVHCLNVEPSPQRPVAVDRGLAHRVRHGWRIRLLHGRRSCRSDRKAIEPSDQSGDQVWRCCARKCRNVDVAEANGEAPITHCQTALPLEVVPICLIGVSVHIVNRPFTHVTVLESAHLTLREDTVDRLTSPRYNPDRGVGRTSPLHVDHVVRSLGERRINRIVARRKTHEPLRVYRSIPVEDRLRHLLVHALQERLDFGEPELRCVAVQISNVLVNHAVRFEVAASISDLRGGALAVRNAVVQQTPSGLW